VASEVIYDSVVPMPSSGRGYTENLGHVREWQERFALTSFRFCKGLDAGKSILEFDSHHVTDQALLLYEDQYRKLAAQVPEFLVWTRSHPRRPGVRVRPVDQQSSDQRFGSHHETKSIAAADGLPPESL
jgi:hypothetical protein